MPDTISNPDGKDFDFGDQEFWEYYGLAPDVALAIAEGFPEYWQDAAAWYMPSYNIAECMASQRRRLNLNSLATASIPGTRPKAHQPQNAQKANVWTKNDLWMQYAAKHFPDEYRKSQSVESDHPFEQLLNTTLRRRFAVTLEHWQDVASRLADQLQEIKSQSSRRLPKGHKRRELLEDGLLFVDGARLARQDVLQDLNALEEHSHIRWGPLTYRDEHAYSTNYFVIGVPQSGKTTLLRLLIQSIFSRQNLRLVLYDHKTDLISVLTPPSGSSTTDHFYIFNPYDSRSVGWDVAADVSENSADTLASILVPARKEGDQHYFTRTTRNVLAETIKILIQKARQANKKWTLLHLMLAIRPSNLRSVLGATSEGRETYEAHIKGDSQTQQNVRSELDDCSKRYLRVAAAWSRTGQVLLSLTEWARSHSNRKGIILGNNDRYRRTIQPLNQAILYFLCGELLDQTIPKHFRTFMILDEFERLGRIPELADTVHTSPGRKLNLVFGVHDFDTLKAHYGDAMHGILGTCGFKAFLRVENSNVAELLSKRIGNQGVHRPHTSSSLAQSQSQLRGETNDGPDEHDEKTRSSGTTTTTTDSEQYQIRRVVPPEAITSLYLPSAGEGLNGYFQGPPYTAFYKGVIDSDILFATSPTSDDACSLWSEGPDKDFEPRDEADFQPPDDLFEPLRDLGFERDDTPHSAPLRAKAPPISTIARPLDTAPLPNEGAVAPEDIDITDMPKRVRRNKVNDKLEF